MTRKKRDFSSVEWLAHPWPWPSMETAATRTLAQAKAWLYREWTAGKISKCPCCNRTVKIYPRKINESFVRVMIKLHRDGRVPIRDIFLDGKTTGNIDFQKLLHWQLVRQIETDKQEFYELTARGVAFLRGEVSG